MKQILRLFLLPLALLLLTACPSDPVDTTGSIAGIVKDKITGANLQGATVSVEGYGRSITGADGRYEFHDVERGTYKVAVSCANYESDEKTVSVRVGETTTADFSLTIAGPVLEVPQLIVDFGTDKTQLPLEIKNTGQAAMVWELVVDRDLTWLLCAPTSGTVQAGMQTSILLSAERAGLSIGNYSGNLVITTKGGGSATIRVTMTVERQSGALPEVALIGVDQESVTDVAATFQGQLVKVGSSNVTHHGFCWSTDRNPSLSQGNHMDLGVADQPQSFSYSAAGLSPNTTYYVRAYAINAEGTVYSTNEVQFTTKTPQGVPKVETGAASQITATTAQVAANILAMGHDAGIIAHGHVWSSENREPTTDYSSTELGVKKQTGSYASALKDLKPGTTYYVRAYARNAYGTGYGQTVSFTTQVGAVKLTTHSASAIVHNEATCGGRITDLQGNTVKERGVCWNTASNPTRAHSYKASADQTDNFTVRISGLKAQTTYHVRAYVIAATGETYYGQDELFTTTHEIRLPQASGTTVSNVGVGGATLRATVTNDGDGNISDAGFCYSTSSSPSIADYKLSCGTQTSTFSKVLTGLQENTRYYVRAYVTNERGTGYGAQAEFTTLKVTVPTLSAVTASGITFKSATFTANVTSVGNGTLKRTGFVYATAHNPTLSNHRLDCGTATGLQAKTSALTANTTYYVRAFAENEKGVAYSSELTIRTKEEPEGTNIGMDDYGKDQSWDNK